MRTTRGQALIAAALVCVVAFTTTVSRAADPLPSWNEGQAKQAIVAFVEKVTTDPARPKFVPPAGTHRHLRQDGTLWCRTSDVPVR